MTERITSAVGAARPDFMKAGIRSMRGSRPTTHGLPVLCTDSTSRSEKRRIPGYTVANLPQEAERHRLPYGRGSVSDVHQRLAAQLVVGGVELGTQIHGVEANVDAMRGGVRLDLHGLRIERLLAFEIVGVTNERGAYSGGGADSYFLRTQVAVQTNRDLLGAVFRHQRILSVSGPNRDRR